MLACRLLSPETIDYLYLKDEHTGKVTAAKRRRMDALFVDENRFRVIGDRPLLCLFDDVLMLARTDMICGKIRTKASFGVNRTLFPCSQFASLCPCPFLVRGFYLMLRKLIDPGTPNLLSHP